MAVDDQIKKAFQDLIAPERHELRGRIAGGRGEVLGFRGETRGELQAVRADIRRLDQKIDGVDRERRTAIDVRERLAALEARSA